LTITAATLHTLALDLTVGEHNMATLTAFRFDTVDGADNALAVISMLQEQQLITILDAALVSWPRGKNRPSTRQVVSPTGTQLLDGTFWGMLFGLIFFVPVLDAGCRAEMERLTSALSDVGIDDNTSTKCAASLPRAHRRCLYFHGMLWWIGLSIHQRVQSLISLRSTCHAMRR
jgi:uncharacterized membrane protein